MDLARIANPAAATITARGEPIERALGREAAGATAVERTEARGSDAVQLSAEAVKRLEDEAAAGVVRRKDDDQALVERQQAVAATGQRAAAAANPLLDLRA